MFSVMDHLIQAKLKLLRADSEGQKEPDNGSPKQMRACNVKARVWQANHVSGHVNAAVLQQRDPSTCLGPKGSDGFHLPRGGVGLLCVTLHAAR